MPERRKFLLLRSVGSDFILVPPFARVLFALFDGEEEELAMFCD